MTKEDRTEMQATAERTMTRTESVIVWKLELDVEHTRKALIHRARSLAERLNRVADGLDADPDYSFNTLGELQGNGVELDTWCAKLGQGRELLKLLRQAQEADAQA
jgi:hypothetical protein